jgi:hypothetical protein
MKMQLSTAGIAALMMMLGPSSAFSQSAAPDTAIQALLPDVTFMTSGGYWQAPDGQNGYYRLLSVRQPDRSARVYIQKIAVSAAGAEAIAGTEIEAIGKLHARVTDIRPHDTDGSIKGPGFWANVFVQPSQSKSGSQSWTVFINAQGTLQVGPTKN